MQKWLLTANGEKYNHSDSFKKNGYIDWNQKDAKYAVGDIVYIYCASPQKKVRFLTCVTAVNIPAKARIDDKEFWIDKEGYEESKKGAAFRLQLVAEIDRDELGYEELKKHGLKTVRKEHQKVSAELADYLDQYIDDCSAKDFFPDNAIPEGSFEGATKKITVNKYERSATARQKCIEHFGCKCYICGLDFKKKYGDIGDGFIHVHHIVPLNQIGKEYVVDYEKDLIPVCPNCHAMLHRTIDGREVTIDELKQMIKS